jgi:CHAT domain-containing protein/Tfp pilus assembly protein PilF
MTSTKLSRAAKLLAISLLILAPSAGRGDDAAETNAATSARLAERDRLWTRAKELQNEGKNAEAIAQARAVIAIEGELLGPDKAELISRWNLIGRCAEAAEDWNAAESARDESLRIATTRFGNDDWRTTDARLAREHVKTLKGLSAADRQTLQSAIQANRQVVKLYQAGRYTDALEVADQTRDARERILGPDHPDMAVSLNNVAMLYESQGNHAAAEPLFKRALEITEKAFGPGHPEVSVSLNNLAGLYYSESNLTDAEPLFQRALKIAKKAFGPDHSRTATSLNNLAVLYLDQGNYAAAEPLHQRALKIREKVLGPEHPSTATSLNNLAALYELQGNHAAAEPLFQRALEIREKALGPDHPDVAVSLNNLATLYKSQGHYGTAEPLYRRALETKEKALGVDHPETATSLNNLASLYEFQGHDVTAEPLYRRALEIREKALGPDHLDTATCLNNLAGLYLSRGNYAAAEPLFKRTLKILENALGPDHPNTAVCLGNVGYLEWRRGCVDAARPLFARCLAIQIGQLERTAAVQTEQQQFLMAKDAAHHLSGWLSVTANNHESSASATWRYVLVWKGLTTTRQLTLRRALKDDPTYAAFRRVSHQLSTLTLNPPLPPSSPQALVAWNERAPELRHAWEDQRAAMEREHERLEKELAQKWALFREEQRQRQVTPQAVQSALSGVSGHAALVDVLEYFHRGKADEPSESRIAAFIARGDRDVLRVELGAAKSIADLIERWRKSFGQSEDSRQAARELRRRLWQPLGEHLEGCDTVLISPDGQLIQFPWGALPGKEPGTYLLEERAIALIPTPQLLPATLAEEPRRPAADDPVLLVGDIDFDAEPMAADQAGREHEPTIDLGLVGGLNPPARALEGTREEIDEIGKLRRTVFGARTALSELTKEQATESALNESAPKARHLHIATHGYFEEVHVPRGIELASNDRGLRASPTSFSALDQQAESMPLVRSGLLLASVNRPRPSMVEDGKWTALEIGALDLSGVDMVVLSACDTGVGTIVGGEGVLGLQRSFHAAGARSCVTSLWKVDDVATQLLMVEFYRNLWEKKLGKLEALRQAQLSMLRGGKARLLASAKSRGLELPEPLPDDSNDVPPYYWAAFVLSGDWR